MKIYRCRTLLLGVLLHIMLLLGGCANPNMHADRMAQVGGLQRARITTDSFVLTTFSRISRQDLPLSIYIEGDGLAWRSRNQPSDNPTPHQALGLALAVADPAENVVYLSRPCQFTPMALNPLCNSSYWTSKRYATEVVLSIDQAVTQYAAQVPGQRLHFVGYSGGGALAVLVAARRSDVASLRTVAGNLDVAEVNRLHGVSPMPESQNPIDVARHVAAIPQIHFSGADDQVVPALIAQRFVAASASGCVQARIVPSMAHDSDWGKLWLNLLALVPSCF